MLLGIIDITSIVIFASSILLYNFHAPILSLWIWDRSALGWVTGTCLLLNYQRGLT